MATVSLTVYSGVEAKLNHEFSNFGPNVIATARRGALEESDLARIKAALGDKDVVVPVAYAIVSGPSNLRMVMGGAGLQQFRELNSWWSTTPLGGSDGNALMGSRVAEALAAQKQKFTVTYGGKTAEIRPEIVFQSGSDDDSRVYLDLARFESFTGVRPSAAQIHLSGPPAEIERQIARLGSSLPQVEFQPVRQVTAAQTAVLGKTRSVVMAASAVVVALIVLCMVATLTGSVLERRKDFAVMKALGASDAAVDLLFAGEAMLVGLAGAILGFMAGSGFAFWIGKANFGAALPPRPSLLAPVLFGSVMVALVASTAPLRLLRKIQPASILRGE